jgi:hypothetical protein
VTGSEPAFESSEALVRSILGRELIRDGEHGLMRATRRWLKDNHCPQAPHANDRGAYLVPAELATRFRREQWPRIKHLARRIDIPASSRRR